MAENQETKDGALKQEEVEQEEQQQTDLAQDAAEESAAFDASFEEEARGDEPPATEPEKSTEEESGETAESTEIAEAQADESTEEQPPIVFAGMTEAQLTATLAKIPALEQTSQAEMRKLHGKLGEFNRTLQELQKSGTNRTSVKVAKEQLKRLNEEFPEIAEMLAEDLSGFDLSGSGVTESDISPKVEKLVADGITAVTTNLERDMKVSLLKIQHGENFQSLLYEQEQVTEDGVIKIRPKKDENGNLIQQPDFAVWLQTQPEAERTKIEDTWDPVYLSGKLTEFKDWRNKKQQRSQNRQGRLRNAISPNTSGAPARTGPPTEEDGFNSVFK
jgi:hypothetical protein